MFSRAEKRNEGTFAKTNLLRNRPFVSQCYDPGDHLKKCRSPDLESAEKVLQKSAGPKRGAEGRAEESAPGSVSCSTFIERQNPEHFFRHFPRHPVSGRHFPKHFFGTFPGQGFSTSLCGRQDRNPKGPSCTKNTTDSRFTIRSKFATAIVKHYGGRTETTIFKGKPGSKSLQK